MKQLTTDITFEGGGHLTQEQIIDFEKKYDIKLPKYFVDFLMRYSGVRPKEYVYNVDENDYIINVFLILSNLKNDCIEKIYTTILKPEEEDGLGRSDLIPFAIDPGGSIFYLSIGEDDNGNVYYERLWTGKLRKLANSFEEFIDGLHAEELS